MEQPTLGKLAPENACRDAIHIAIAPVIASERLRPGEPIGFIDATNTENVASSDAPIGLVDPFLMKPVRPGERFYMLLFPQTITSLRHEWIHPAFDPVPFAHAADSKKKIQEIADAIGISYDEIMRGAHDWVSHEDYLVQQDSQGWRDQFPGYQDEFWQNYEIVTATKVENKGQFFSCSC